MKLSDFELFVMQILWQSAPASAPQIHQVVEQDKDVTYATVKTIINRLEEKGAVARSHNEGRTIFYQPLVSEQEIKTPLFKSMVQRIFGSEKHALFNHIVKEEPLSKDDIEYLESILAEKKRQLDQE